VIRLPRLTALVLVAPFLTFASAMAPPHVHEAGPDHDHAIAHSHFAPHDTAQHDAETAEIEHDIEHIVWLDSAFVHQPIHNATHASPAIRAAYETVRADCQWSVVRFDHAAPPHGPPKNPNALRGPPSAV
jgi:hypothetical protein